MSALFTFFFAFLTLVTLTLGAQALSPSSAYGSKLQSAERTVAALRSLRLTELAKRTTGDDPSPPTLAPSWSSPLTLIEGFYFPSKNSSVVLEGSLNYLASVGAYLQAGQTLDFAPPGIPGVILVNIFNEEGTQVIINDQCRRVSSDPAAGDWFDWLPYSTYIGQSPCNPNNNNGNSSLQCTWWQLTTSNVSMQLAVNNQLPYRWTVVQHLAPRIDITIDYVFTAPVVQSFDDSMFASLPDCSLPYAPPCPYTPLRPVIEMIRFHEPNQTSLAQQNTGDVAGDTSFLCMTLLGDAFTMLQQVSMYEVQVNFTFGSYAFCNEELCLGGDPVLVGREASLGLGYPRSGQCTPNPYGTWYSMPFKGECRGSQTIEAGECTWKVVKTIKTIDVDCLVAQGFLLACQKDVVMPFPRAQAVLLNALASSDPGAGGCPAV